MGNIEEASARPHRFVLIQDGGKVKRDFPFSESAEMGTCFDMKFVQRKPL